MIQPCKGKTRGGKLAAILMRAFSKQTPAGKIAKRLDCAGFSGAFVRTKAVKRQMIFVRAKSGAKDTAVQTLRAVRSRLPNEGLANTSAQASPRAFNCASVQPYSATNCPTTLRDLNSGGNTSQV